MTSVSEVAASLSDYVMTQGIKVQTWNHHSVIHSLKEHESAVFVLHMGTLRLQEVE